mmetsp:Transcript_12537/g.15578  ORF Transcript_12537/g.15578 Transcript_12537/m.15578 type:complete len:204 (+) Transcript_12537:627-1238(+)
MTCHRSECGVCFKACSLRRDVWTFHWRWWLAWNIWWSLPIGLRPSEGFEAESCVSSLLLQISKKRRHRKSPCQRFSRMRRPKKRKKRGPTCSCWCRNTSLLGRLFFVAVKKEERTPEQNQLLVQMRSHQSRSRSTPAMKPGPALLCSQIRNSWTNPTRSGAKDSTFCLKRVVEGGTWSSKLPYYEIPLRGSLSCSGWLQFAVG